MKYKALNMYSYWDGPTVFTFKIIGINNPWNIYIAYYSSLNTDTEQLRIYDVPVHDNHNFTISEDEVDWSDVKV